MKRISIAAVLCLMLCTGCSVQEGLPEDNSTENWQSAYQAVLREKAGLAEGQFALLPLDRDEIPELWINLDNMSYLYHFNGTEAVCIVQWETLHPARPDLLSFQPGRETIAEYTYSMGTGSGYLVYVMQDLEMVNDRRWIFDMGYMDLEYMMLDAEMFDINIIDEKFFELGESWVNGETNPDLLKDMTEDNFAALDTIWETTGAVYLIKE